MYSEAGQGSFGKTQDWTLPIFSSGPFPPWLWHPCQVICSGKRGTGGDLSGLLNTVQNYKCGCSKAPPGMFPGSREVRSDSALVESQRPQERTIPSYILIQSRWPRLIPNFIPPSSRWPRPAPGLARSLAPRPRPASALPEAAAERVHGAGVLRLGGCLCRCCALRLGTWLRPRARAETKGRGDLGAPGVCVSGGELGGGGPS